MHSLRIVFLTLGCLLASISRAEPTDQMRTPVTVVSHNVHVSIGPKMALVVGRFWLQYVPKLDDDSPRVAVQCCAFVPQGVTDYAELLEISQIKLMLGEREFRPESARILEASELGKLQAAPTDAAVAWFTFQIPRDLARLRFDVIISHMQPTYQYEGQTVAAYLPWLPQLEPLRLELELKDIDHVVTMEALPGSTVKLISTVTALKESSPQKIVLHPRHFENVAVAVSELAQPKS